MKKNIIIGTVLIVLLMAGFFGWKFFYQKKTSNVPVQSSVSEIVQPTPDVANNPAATNDQPAENNPAEKNNSPQSAPAVPKDDTKNNSTDTAGSTKNAGPVKSDDHGVNKIVDRFISWGFQKASNRKIDTIIIHSSYDALGSDPYSVDGIIAEFKQYGVSAHYLIGRDGTIYHLVADQNIAYHAGVAAMPDGRTGVNSFSLGIEMVNTMDGQFTAAQYSALNGLIASLKKQYPIKYVLGHSDIAPGRKTDPWNIDWSKVQK